MQALATIFLLDLEVNGLNSVHVILSRVLGHFRMFQLNHTSHFYICPSFFFPGSIVSVVYFQGLRVFFDCLSLTTKSSPMWRGEEKDFFSILSIIIWRSLILSYLSLCSSQMFLFWLSPLPEEIHLFSLINCDVYLSTGNISTPTHEGSLHRVADALPNTV